MRQSTYILISVLLLLVSKISYSNITGLFIENKGQWPNEVLYKTAVPGADIWITEKGIVYAYYNGQDLKEIHDHEHGHHHNHDHEEELFFRGHVYRMNWPGESKPFVSASDKQKPYFNYIKGRKQENWVGHAESFKKLRVELEDGLYYELLFYNNQLKYNIWLDGSKSIQKVVQEYEGLDQISVVDNQLVLQHSFDKVIEQIPLAFQVVNNDSIKLECKYQLDGNKVSFELPSNTVENTPICIDPIVVASTFTGATVMTLGHSATYDQAGNVFGAGRPIGDGFPTTLGAYKYDYTGSWNDVGIVKFNPDGSDLIWATYLGGTVEDLVHSIVVNSKRELVIYGKTNSLDFPVLDNAYDTSYNQAYDIFVSVLSPDGSTLNASTLLGGVGDDGQNVVNIDAHSGFKGEVNIDKFDNIYLASSSNSPDLILKNGFDTTNNGFQDGLLVKFSSDLSTMLWGNYLGGGSDDVLLGVRVNKEGNVYTCGVTESYNYPVTSNVYQQNYGGGDTEGIISCISADGSQLLHSTFYGGVYNDELLFIDIDKSGDVYCLGESETESATPGHYEGPSIANTINHGGLVIKMSPDLQTKHWASVFHRMNFTAFLVDDCYRIYTSGYEPQMNLVDVTPNAVSTVNEGFYMMVLEPDATGISFGSYYGGNSSHVDGGTSRFDKRGVITQATCTYVVFPLNPNAWSDNMNGNYDLAIFKIDMESNVAAAYAAPKNYPIGCTPFDLTMTNAGSQGANGSWLIDSIQVSTADSFTHVFNNTGYFEVMYVVEDASTCNIYDTAVFYVEVLDEDPYDIVLDTSMCHDQITLELTGGDFDEVLWANGSDSMLTTVSNDTVFWVQMENHCGIRTDSFLIDVLAPVEFDPIQDTGTCDSVTITLPYSSDYNYAWGSVLGGNSNSQTFDASGIYTYSIDNGVCTYEDTIQVEVYQFDLAFDDTLSCHDSILITLDGQSSAAQQLTWSNGSHDPSIWVAQSGPIGVSADFGDCELEDSISVTLEPIGIEILTDSVICEAKEFEALAIGNGKVEWSNGDSSLTTWVDESGWVWVSTSKLDCEKSDSVYVDLLEYFLADSVWFCEGEEVEIEVNEDFPTDYNWSNGGTGNTITISKGGWYTMTASNQFCKTTKSVWAEVMPIPFFDLGEDRIVCPGQPILLDPALNADSYVWSDGDSSSFIYATDDITYTLTAEKNGCIHTDSIHIEYKSELSDDLFFNPNIITPNFDGKNDRLRFLKVDADEIGEYKLSIYNRWGGLMFETDDPLEYWEGANQGNENLPVGTYFFIVQYRIACETAGLKEFKGHITLLR